MKADRCGASVVCRPNIVLNPPDDFRTCIPRAADLLIVCAVGAYACVFLVPIELAMAFLFGLVLVAECVMSIGPVD